MSWLNEGDGNSVSVISVAIQRIAGDFVVGERCMVTYGKKQHATFVHATGVCPDNLCICLQGNLTSK